MLIHDNRSNNCGVIGISRGLPLGGNLTLIIRFRYPIEVNLVIIIPLFTPILLILACLATYLSNINSVMTCPKFQNAIICF